MKRIINIILLIIICCSCDANSIYNTSERGNVKVTKFTGGLIFLSYENNNIFKFVSDFDSLSLQKLKKSIGKNVIGELYNFLNKYSDITFSGSSESIRRQFIFLGSLATINEGNNIEFISYAVHTQTNDKNESIIYMVEVNNFIIHVRNFDEFRNYCTEDNNNYFYQKYVLKQARDGFYDFIRIKTPLESAIGI
ncbi:hypothetical protein QET93_001615 [Akkermansia sp. N21116]|uniref:hypothetical protein n=1 Tax=Akkermansia sp. N21116 TaxID=3040764 RepID=UPI00244EFCE3|nr:hypothetical protein [Akkermansia sp. N21116]WPX40800.1 hypothetical protein QET93_001615 [Akkermansia sp. N21116]